MKAIQKIGIRLTLLIIPLFIICPIMIGNFPVMFLDGEYPAYIENKEYSNNHNEYARILIMGDSTAKAAWLPDELSDDTYNFALGGASPIEEYYCLQEYLRSNEPPQIIIYTQSPRHFLEAETFWTRNVYFHRISMEDMCDLFSELSTVEDTSVLGNKNLFMEYFCYLTYSPIKYSVALFKGILFSKRSARNKETHQILIENKGQIQYGRAEHCEEANICAGYRIFSVNNVIDIYFRKIIELCAKCNIYFVFQSAPLNSGTYQGLHKGFIEGYTSYLRSIQTDYPDTRIDCKLLRYSDFCFGDDSHLNMYGTLKFSKEMRKKYKEIFSG